MRSILAVLLISAIASAAFAQGVKKAEKNPKSESNIALQKWGESAFGTVELLTKVKDEKTAKEHFEKLETLHKELKDRRRDFFRLFAECLNDESDSTIGLSFGLDILSVQFKALDDSMIAQFERIFKESKPAFKVLQPTKFFVDIQTWQERQVHNSINPLLNASRTFSLKNDEKAPTKPADLIPLLEKGEKALNDPWGFPCQFKWTTDENKVVRHYVWTVSPYSGKNLGTPPPDLKADEKK